MSSEPPKWTGLAATASVCLLTAIAIARSKAKDGKTSPSRPLPVHVTWLDEDSFAVFVALMDTILPSFDDSEVTTEVLSQAALTLVPTVPTAPSTMSLSVCMENISHLKRGVVKEANGDVLAVETLQKNGAPYKLKELYLALKALSTSAGCFLLTGYAVPFQQLNLESRTKAMQGFRDSRFAPLRAIFQTFKRVSGAILAGDSNSWEGRANPSWSHLGYDPNTSSGRRQLPKEVQAADDTLRHVLDYEHSLNALHSKTAAGKDFVQVDAVVVGSGAGGGVVAAELVKAGLKVLVLEKGGFYGTTDYKKWHQSEGLGSSFERGGLCTTDDGHIIVLAGATVGGGTAINWSASFRLPEHVRDEWVASGLHDFRKNGAYDNSNEIIHDLMNVNTDNSYHEKTVAEMTDDDFAVNGNNRLMWNAAKELGYAPEKIPRNVKSCVDCGNCCYGCPYKAKQSTLTSLLEPLLLQQHARNCTSEASAAGADCCGTATSGGCGVDARTTSATAGGMLYVIPDCRVDRVLFANDGDHVEKKTAIGVEAEVTCFPPEMDRYRRNSQAAGVTRRRLVVHADVVISSAGALHTPALLLRSGLKNEKIGRHLSLHPVVGVVGVFDKTLQFDKATAGVGTGLASGVGMGVVVRQPPIYAGGAAPSATVATAASAFSSAGAGHSNTFTGSSSSGGPVVFRDDESRHPVALETPPVHPGMLGMLLPWKSGLSFKMQMMSWSHMGVFIGISRDRSSANNRICLDPTGEPRIEYRVTEQDKPGVLAGQEANLRLMRKAGAGVVAVGHETLPVFVADAAAHDSAQGGEPAAFERYVQQATAAGLEPNRAQVFSAHQMSSCRMGATAKDGPVSPSGELFECNRLFVADASVFPTSLGINPMITIESIAHMTSRRVLMALGKEELAAQLFAQDKQRAADLRQRRAAVAATTSAAAW